MTREEHAAWVLDSRLASLYQQRADMRLIADGQLLANQVGLSLRCRTTPDEARALIAELDQAIAAEPARCTPDALDALYAFECRPYTRPTA